MKSLAATRSRARHFAMQAIYQWQMTSNPLNVIEAEYYADNDMTKVDVEYFTELFHGVAGKTTELDEIYTPYLTAMVLEHVDPITRALLRLATYEFKFRLDVPYKVVINESLNLAKKFGAADSHKFINGVLDKTSLDLRGAEVAAERKKRR